MRCSCDSKMNQGFFYVSTVSPSFSLPVCVFFPVVTCCRFQHGPCTGVVLRRSTWYRGALYGILLNRSLFVSIACFKNVSIRFALLNRSLFVSIACFSRRFLYNIVALCVACVRVVTSLDGKNST